MSLLPQIEQSLQALDAGFGVEAGQLAENIARYLLLIEK